MATHPRTLSNTSLSLSTYLILRPDLYLQVEINDGLFNLIVTSMVLASGSLVCVASRGTTVVRLVVVAIAVAVVSITRVFRAVVPLS